MENEPNDTSSKISKMVPEMYFDLICRFVLGSIILGLIWFGAKGKICDIPKVSFAGGLFFIVLAYAVGLCLDAFAHAITHEYSAKYALKQLRMQVAKLKDSSLNADQKKLDLLAKLACKKNKKASAPILDNIRESVRLESPYAKQMMPKIDAEVRSLINLGVGLPLASIVIWYGVHVHLWDGPHKPYHLLFLLAPLEVILLFGIRNRISRTVMRMINWFSKNHNLVIPSNKEEVNSSNK